MKKETGLKGNFKKEIKRFLAKAALLPIQLLLWLAPKDSERLLDKDRDISY